MSCAQHTRRSPTPRVRWGRGGAGRTAAGSAARCQQNPAQNTKFKVQRPNALARRRVACRVKSVNMYITHRAKYKCEDQASVRGATCHRGARGVCKTARQAHAFGLVPRDAAVGRTFGDRSPAHTLPPDYRVDEYGRCLTCMILAGPDLLLHLQDGTHVLYDRCGCAHKRCLGLRR